MEPWSVVVVDTAAIQPYVFGSNNLKQIVGASGLVHWATHGAVYAKLPKPHNVLAADRELLDETLHMEEHGLQAEIVYSGGGNTVLVARNSRVAQEFTRRYTLSLLQEAPGLQVVVAHTEFDWDNELLKDAVRATLQKISCKKRQQTHLSAPLPGLGVTADCQFTGAPAVAELLDEDQTASQVRVRVSAEVKAKAAHFGQADQRLRQVVGDARGEYDFIYNFDQLGEEDRSSYMAVVHMDGNGMGNRVAAVLRNVERMQQGRPIGEQNRGYIDEMRAFSASITAASEDALRAVIRQLRAAIQDGKIGGVVAVNDLRLPFRPLVFGGDDITFVCDGRLGLAITQHYLALLESRKLTDDEYLYERAGVAVVKSHYPVARAYQLAEDLANSAKQLIRSHSAPGELPRLSAMDWHFAVNGLVRPLDELRAQTCTYAQEQDLIMRPLLLRDYAGVDEWVTWPTFTMLRDAFADPNGPWFGKRNKVKALREALRQGPDGVRRFMSNLDARHHLPAVAGDAESASTGWVRDPSARHAAPPGAPRSVWFDAIEALDFNVGIEPKAERQPKQGLKQGDAP